MESASSTSSSTTTEEQLRSYVQNQRLSITFVEVEDRHGFRILRNILKEINDSLVPLTKDGKEVSSVSSSSTMTVPPSSSSSPVASTWSILPLLNELLSLPTDLAYECSPLPLPHPPTVSLPPPSLRLSESYLVSCSYPSLLHPCTCVTELPLAHKQCPPSFTSALRGNQAYRTDNALASATDLSTATSTYGTVTKVEGTLLSWCHQSFLVLETVKNIFGYLLQHTTLAPYRNILRYVQNMNNCRKYRIPDDFLLQFIINLVPFCMYTAWNQSSLHRVSNDIIDLLVQTSSLPSVQTVAKSSTLSSTSSTPSSELSLCLVDLFPEIMDYCRIRSIQNKWKNSENITVRYLTVWLITRIQHPHLSLSIIQSSLPMTLRICDDWDAQNIWLGLSALIHILQNSNFTDLRQYKELIKEIIQRIFTSARHPLLVHCVSYLYALMGPTLFGPCPAYDTLSTNPNSTENPLQRILRTGTGGTSTFGKTGVPIGPFDGPYDLFLQDIFRSLAMVNSSHLQYGLLSSFNILIFQMKEYTARYLQFMVPILCKLMIESYDSRVVCTSVFTLRSLLVAVPERLTVPPEVTFNDVSTVSENNCTTETSSILAIIDILITTLLDAYKQNREGKYILPVVNEDGVLSYPGAPSLSSASAPMDNGSDITPTTIEIIDTAAQNLVQHYLQSLFNDLLRINNKYLLSVCSVLSSSTGDAELRTSLHELRHRSETNPSKD